MRNRTRHRSFGRRQVCTALLTGLGHCVTTIVDDGNMNVTTVAPHGFSTSQQVVITGTSHADYNGTERTISEVTSVTTFRFDDAGLGANSYGGRVDAS